MEFINMGLSVVWHYIVEWLTVRVNKTWLVACIGHYKKVPIGRDTRYFLARPLDADVAKIREVS